MLRKALVRIKKENANNKARLLQYAGGVFIAAALAGVLLDVFAPFSGIWNLLRSLVLVPLSASVFVLGYTLSLHMNKQQSQKNPDWVPYRMRFSQKWRRNISAIIAAVIFVFIYGTGFSPVYTLVSSCFVAIIIGLFVFMRATTAEANRDKLGIPDTRDLQYDNYRKKLQQARAKARDEKKVKKKNDDEDE